MATKINSVASTSQKPLLKCKSFAADMTTSSNTVHSRRIEYEDEADEEEQLKEQTNVTSNSTKKRASGRKRKSRVDDDDDFKPEEKKKKTPGKKRLPPLKLNYHKIYDFFPKASESRETKETPSKRRQATRVPAVSEVVILSSSEEEFQAPNKHSNSSQRKKKTKHQSDNTINVVQKSIKSVENTVQTRTRKNLQPMFSENCSDSNTIDMVQKSNKSVENTVQTQTRTNLQPMFSEDCQDNNIIDVVQKSNKSVENTVQTRTRTNLQPMSSEDSAIEKGQHPIKCVENFLQRSKRTKLQSTCPNYKVIEGTNFAVDAFRFGEITGITKYFLTHFHVDHYVGLTKKFNMPLYLSRITGRLVNAIIKVNPKHIKPMDINTTYVIDDVEVTAIDANHCPGAVMFIFKLKNGRTILHTGDFRACPEMESNPVFWNNDFYSIYLDTTYLHKSYDFDTQSDALYNIEEEVKKFKEKNIGVKFLIVVGSYLIGKERVWAHIAQSFEMKVWLEPERRKAMNLIYSMENEDHRITDYLTDIPEEAQLHVLPMQCINYSYLVDYVKNFEDHNLLAFRPTGWEKNSKPQYGSRISIVGVQYSEHSSYRDLERFVRFVRPEKVISTVPKSSSNPNLTEQIPQKWLRNVIKPMKFSNQSTITNFMKIQKNAPSIHLVSTKPKLSITLSKICESLNGEDPESSDTDFMY